MIAFKLLLIIVDIHRTQDVLQAALDTGATGATVLGSARGMGMSKSVTFFGLDLTSPREVLLVIAEERRADPILDAVKTAGQLDETMGTGIALQISVDKVIGLSELIKVWEQKFSL